MKHKIREFKNSRIQFTISQCFQQQYKYYLAPRSLEINPDVTEGLDDTELSSSAEFWECFPPPPLRDFGAAPASLTPPRITRGWWWCATGAASLPLPSILC
mmetsp:Transcript_26385/g.39154  ORF Transcript_26385/g.39154 Transcript_26385/m.39154 type:complete len:101 (-) Transcript_26385:2488-2790(-)